MTDEFLLQKLETLMLSVQQLATQQQAIFARLKELGDEINRGRGIVEQLAEVSQLEYIEELKQWVAKSKWQELRANPRWHVEP